MTRIMPIAMVFIGGIVSWINPSEEPFSIIVFHVDAAMAHAVSKIIVPICAVKRNSSIKYEKSSPGNSGKGLASRRTSCYYSSHMF